MLKSTYEGFPSVDMTRVVVREIGIAVGSRCGPFDKATISLLERGLVDPTSLIAKTFHISRA